MAIVEEVEELADIVVSRTKKIHFLEDRLREATAIIKEFHNSRYGVTEPTIFKKASDFLFGK